MRIGILLPNWIGDVIMATPTLRALRRHYGPDATITGVMRPYVAKVLDGTNWLDETIFHDRRSDDPQLRTWALAKKLRQLRLDTVILMPNSLRTGVVGFLSGASERVGYVRYGRGPFLNRKLYPPRNGRQLRPVSGVDYYLELAYAVGCPPQPRHLELATLPEDEAGADQVWQRLGLTSAKRVVTFNTGGARGAAKHWPSEYFVELARRIVRDSDNAVLVLCGPSEREAAGEIERGADHPRVKSMTEQDLSLGVAKACVRRSQLLVTTDSGPRFYAPAFDVPVVALFGPIDYRWSATGHPKELAVQKDVPCGPCGRRVCPFDHHDCMRGLSVEHVFASVNKSLYGSDKQAA